MRALRGVVGVLVFAGLINAGPALASPGWISPSAALSAPSGATLGAQMVATNSRGDTVVVWPKDNTGNFLGSVADSSTKAAGSSTWSAPASTGVSGGITSVRDAVDSSGDVAAVFGFSGSDNLSGATLTAGGSWTASHQI